MNSRHIEVCHIRERNHQLMHLFNRLLREYICFDERKSILFLNIKIYFRNKSKLVIKQLYFLPNKSIFNCRPDIISMHVCFFFNLKLYSTLKLHL